MNCVIINSNRSSCQFVHCWRTRTPMIRWCRRLLTCTRLIGPSMNPPLAPGHRSTPWAKASQTGGRVETQRRYHLNNHQVTTLPPTKYEWTFEGCCAQLNSYVPTLWSPFQSGSLFYLTVLLFKSFPKSYLLFVLCRCHSYDLYVINTARMKILRVAECTLGSAYTFLKCSHLIIMIVAKTRL